MNEINSRKKTYAYIAVALLAAGLAALIIYDLWQTKAGEEFSRQSFAMGSFITVSGTGNGADEACNEAFAAVNETEKNISRRIDSSVIAKVNAVGEAEADEKTARLITDVLGVCEKSDGALDITVGGLSQLWDFDSGEKTVPSDDDIEAELSHVGWSSVSVSGNTVSAAPSQKLDLGCVGKGAACDDIVRVLRSKGIGQTVISVGGSVAVIGDNGAKGWKIGIKNPFSQSSTDCFAYITTSDSFISTSGSYEKFFILNDELYHHILSPFTGRPAKGTLVSVSVLAPSGWLSDALSTACFVLGYEKSIPLLRQYSCEALFVFEDGTVKYTQGLSGIISIEKELTGEK